jgi:chemotaxis signal transduction protein
MKNRFADHQAGRVLRCQVLDQTFGVDLSWVAGVHRGDAPGAGGGLAVVSLAERLGLQERDQGARPVVSVRSSGAAWGLLVDRVLGAVHVTADQRFALRALSPACSTGPFRTVFVRGSEGMFLGLDLAELSPEPMPPDELDDASAPMALPVGRGAQSGGRIVLFTPLGLPDMGRPVRVGLSVSQVLEVTEPLPILTIPTAPSFVCGLVCWRDRPVPVIDLAARFGFATDRFETGGRLLVARVGADAGLIGIPVRSSVQVRPLPLRHVASTYRLSVPDELLFGAVETEEASVVVPNLRACLES